MCTSYLTPPCAARALTGPAASPSKEQRRAQREQRAPPGVVGPSGLAVASVPTRYAMHGGLAPARFASCMLGLGSCLSALGLRLRLLLLLHKTQATGRPLLRLQAAGRKGKTRKASHSRQKKQLLSLRPAPSSWSRGFAFGVRIMCFGPRTPASCAIYTSTTIASRFGLRALNGGALCPVI
jgi:hypothetical protein